MSSLQRHGMTRWVLLAVFVGGCGGQPFTLEQQAYRTMLESDVVAFNDTHLSKFDGAFVAWSWTYHIHDLLLSGQYAAAAGDLVAICEQAPLTSVRYYDGSPRQFLAHDGRLATMAVMALRSGMVKPDAASLLDACIRRVVDRWEPYWSESQTSYLYHDSSNYPLAPWNMQATMILPLAHSGNADRAHRLLDHIMAHIHARGWRYADSPYVTTAEDVSHSNHVLFAFHAMGREADVQELKGRFSELREKAVKSPVDTIWAWCLVGRSPESQYTPSDIDEYLANSPQAVATLGLLKTACGASWYSEFPGVI